MIEKIKSLGSFLWLFVAGFGLWIVYKLFISDEEQEKPVTPASSGLSASDCTLFNKVVENLLNGGNPYDIFVGNGITMGISSLIASQNSQDAVKLGQLLNNVNDKKKFSEVFFHKFNKDLPTRICEVYGETVFVLIANNVPSFDEFYF